MSYIRAGEMAERSIAAVLKTVEGNTSGGSNPSLSAEYIKCPFKGHFLLGERGMLAFQREHD